MKIFSHSREGKTEAVLQDAIDLNEDVNSFDSKGLTPLIHSILGGSIEVAKLLLDLGANPNLRSNDANGYSPLHIAINCDADYDGDWSNFVQLLIDCGAEVDIKSNRGSTPLNDSLTHWGDGKIYSEKIAYILLRNGADVDIACCIDDNPILNIIRAKDHLELMMLMIESSKMVNTPNPMGSRTPLQLATQADNTLAINILQKMIKQ